MYKIKNKRSNYDINIIIKLVSRRDLNNLKKWRKNPIGGRHLNIFIAKLNSSISTPTRRKSYLHIIYYKKFKIGYIKTFWHSKRKFNPVHLPSRTASFHIYIMEASYQGKGLGSLALSKIVSEFIFTKMQANLLFACPKSKNITALKAYKKVGFKLAKRTGGFNYLILSPTKNHHSTKGLF